MASSSSAGKPDIADDEAMSAISAAGGLRAIRINKEKVSKLETRPMDWGADGRSRRHFFKQWEKTIQEMDGAVFRQSGYNIYKYLMEKLSHVLNTKRSIGMSGWAFAQARATDYVAGVVWADGSHAQLSPLIQPRAGEQWWPCIFLNDPFSLACPSQRAFYCPALAWMDARPWTVHEDRVREVFTPGVVIEELPESEVSSAANELEWHFL